MLLRYHHALWMGIAYLFARLYSVALKLQCFSEAVASRLATCPATPNLWHCFDRSIAHAALAAATLLFGRAPFAMRYR
ncbi:MAG: hypothetical protein WAM39_24320, partial [Bryobacteraceae bacterium]